MGALALTLFEFTVEPLRIMFHCLPGPRLLPLLMLAMTVNA
jgi:hypothetical protein